MWVACARTLPMWRLPIIVAAVLVPDVAASSYAGAWARETLARINKDASSSKLDAARTASKRPSMAVSFRGADAEPEEPTFSRSLALGVFDRLTDAAAAAIATVIVAVEAGAEAYNAGSSVTIDTVATTTTSDGVALAPQASEVAKLSPAVMTEAGKKEKELLLNPSIYSRIYS